MSALTQSWQNLDVGEHCKMMNSVSTCTKLFPTLTYGTLFSGCEVFSHAVNVVVGMWHSWTGVVVQTELEFIVEHDEWKREFARSHFSVKRAFGDAVQLANNNFKGTDYVSGGEADVPKVVMCISSFECDR